MPNKVKEKKKSMLIGMPVELEVKNGYQFHKQLEPLLDPILVKTASLRNASRLKPNREDIKVRICEPFK